VNQLVTYKRSGRVAEITMDDGKVNAMSPAMLSALHLAFDRAESESVVVILTGRDKLFSAGFDLKILANGAAEDVYNMIKLGADLTVRLLSFPTPVVTACNGSAFPMGAFLMLSSDIRIGADGPFKIGLNEVAIGLTVPRFGMELARYRLTPAYFNRTVVTGEMFAPGEAAVAGFLDHVVPPDELRGAAEAAAIGLTKIDLPSHVATKARARAQALDALRVAIAEEITLENWHNRVAARATQG
jgi:enoyl-CoA hydratase